MQIFIFLLLLGYGWASFLPNGCPADFSVHLLLPHETDCTKFYQCSNGNKITMQCARGTAFDVELQTCNWADAVGCIQPTPSTTTTTTRAPSSTTTAPSTTTRAPSTTTRAPTTTTAPPVQPDECPSDFDVILKLPHEIDCDKYYNCSDGVKILLKCPIGKHFDMKLQDCDLAQNVNCTSGGDGGDRGDALLPNGCPVDFHIHKLLPHESDCTKFYYCNFGNKIERNCPGGTHFNPKLQVCDWPESAGCVSGGDGVGDWLPNGCPSDFSIHWLLPHETDCAKFYYCNFGEKVVRNCAPGTHFDPKLQVCNWPNAVNCTTIETTTKPGTTDPSTGTTKEYSTTTTRETTEPSVETTTEYIPTTTRETTEPSVETTTEYIPTTTRETTEPSVETTTEYIPTTTRETTEPSVETTTEYIPTTTRETTEPSVETTTEYIPTTTRETTEPSVETTTEYIPTTTRETTEPSVETTTEYIPTTTRETTEPIVETTTEYIPTTTRETTEPSVETTTEYIPTTTRETTEPSVETTTEYIPTTTKETTEPSVETTTEYIPTTTRETTEPSVETTTEYIPTTTEETTEPSVETTTEYIPTTTKETTEPSVETTTEYIPTTTRETTEPPVETTTEYIPTTTEETTEPSLETTTEYIPTTTKETTEPSVETTTEYSPTTTKETTEPSVETTTEYIPPTTKETTEPSVETTTEYIPTTTRETTEPSVETTTEYIPTTTEETTEPSVETTTEYIPTTTKETTEPSVETTTEYIPTTTKETTEPSVETTTEYSPTTTKETTEPSVETTTEYIPTTTRETTEPSVETTTEYIPTTTEETTEPSVETTTEYIPTTTKETTEPSVETTTEYIPPTTKETTEPSVETTTEYIPTSSQETTKAPVETTTEDVVTTTESIETTTPINIVCPPGDLGFVPHPDYCDAYYICLMGNPTLLRCTEGYEFDPDRNACVEISENGCFASQGKWTPTLPDHSTTETTLTTDNYSTTESDATPPTETTVLPEETTTEYIRTTPSETTTTAQETTTNQETTVPPTTTESDSDPTTIAIETTTNNLTPTTESNTDTTTIAVDTTTENLATATESIETTTPINIECPPGDLGFVPHPDYCDAYYICLMGNPTLLRCTEGYEFDPDRNACVEISENGCFASQGKWTPTLPDQSTTETTLTTDNYGSTTESDVTPPTETTVLPEETTIAVDTTTENLATVTESIETTTPINIECPPGDLGFVPHPDYCDAYYICLMGNPTLLRCTEGYEFDPDRNACVEISENGCFASQGKWTPTLPDQSTTETTLTTDNYGSTTESDATPSTETTVLPEETTTEYIRTTPSETTTTAQETTTNQETTVPPTTTESDSDPTTIAIETTTNNLTPTTESDSDTTTIAVDTTTENLATVTESIETTTPINIECPPGDLGFVPHPDYCDAYYICLMGNPTLLRCTEGYEFDPDRNACVEISENGCFASQGKWTPTLPDQSTTETTLTTDNYGSTTESDVTPPTETTVLPEETTIAVDTTTENLATVTESIETTTPINIECPPGDLGFVPHPDYCDAYYICLMGNPTLLRCTEGYEFDPDRNACVEISENGCFASQGKWTPTLPDQSTTETTLTTDNYGSTTESDATPSTETTVLPEETTTEYIRTTPSETTTTAQETTTNQETTVPPTTTESDSDPTTIAIETTTNNLTPTTESDSDTTTIAVDTTTENLATVTESIETTTPINIECPPGDLGFVPHPDYCDAYYICLMGNPTLLRCTEGYEFDPDRNACVEISENGCFASQGKWTPTLPDQSTTETTLTTDNYGSTTESDVTPPTETTVLPEETTIAVDTTTENLATVTESIETTTPINIECPPGDLGFVPHPDYCDAYYICLMGNPTLLRCTEGYEFDPDRNACVEISENGCFASQGKWTPTLPDQSTTETTLTTDNYGSTTESDATPPTETTVLPEETTIAVDTTTENLATVTESIETTTPINIECPPGDLGFVPHPDYCDAYYICLMGNPTLLRCTEGYEFDPDRNACVEISENGCFASQGKWTPTLPDQSTTETTLTTDNYGSTTVSDAAPPTETTILPEETTIAVDTTTENIATVTESIETTTPINIECPPGMLGYVPHPDYCDAYYMCVMGIPTLMWCSEGNEFDPNVNFCVAISENGCFASKDRPTPDATASTTMGTTVEPIQTTTEAVLCPPGFLGHVPHPEYCDKYYLCIRGIPQPQQCSAGLEFDPERRVCVEISENGCFASQGKWTPTEPDQSTTETTPGETTELPTATTSDYISTTVRVTTEGTTEVTEPTTNSFETTTDEAGTTSDFIGTTVEVSGTTPELTETTTGVTGTTVDSAETTTGVTGTTVDSAETTTGVTGTTVDSTETTTGVTGTTVDSADTTTRVTGTTDDSIETTTGESGTTVVTEVTTPPNICPPGVFGNVPHPELCDVYYMCMAGIPTLLPCTEGYEFDPAEGQCVVISENGCFASKGMWTPTEQHPTTTESSHITTDISQTATDDPIETTTGGSSSTEDSSYTTMGVTSTTVDSAESTTDMTGTTVDSIETTTGFTGTTIEAEVTTPPNICPPGVFGNVPHPELCDVYYMCMAGIPTLLPCTEGYEFDPAEGQCVVISENGCFASKGMWTPTEQHPTTTESSHITTDISQTATDDPIETTTGGSGTTAGSVDTTLEVTGTTDDSIETTTGESGTTVVAEVTTPPNICPPGVFGNVPHPELCDVYYMCMAGIPTLLPCTEGYEFDPAEGQCVVISENGCFASKGMWTPTEQHPTTTESSHITTDISQTATDDPIETTTGGSDSTADSDGTTMEVTGTTDDAIETTTGEPGTTADSIESTTGGTGTPGDSIETTTGVTGTTVEAEVTTPPNICPPGVFGNVPHPELCDVYYMCMAGIPTLLPCTEGYEFNPAVGQCVLISGDGCFASKGMWTPTESNDHTDISVQSTINEDTTSGEIDEDNTPEDKNIADTSTINNKPGDQESTSVLIPTTGENGQITTELIETTTINVCPPNFSGIIPDPERCDRFFHCTVGHPIALYCGVGFEFDINAQRCMPITEDGCYASKGLWTPTESQTTEQETEQPEVTTNADLSTTISDIVIGDNDRVTSESAEETTLDAERLETTASPIEVTTASICPPNIFGNVPDPVRCDKFYMCTGGTAIPLYCGKGFEFDSNVQKCVIISENGCFASRGSPSEDHTENLVVTTDHKMNENSQTTVNVETTSEDALTTPAICPPGVFGNVPDPEECNKFYMCTSGISIPLYCSVGFEFDPVAKDCVIISDHGCTASKS